MRRRRLPCGEPSLDLFLRHFECEGARGDVEDDCFAFSNRGNRPTHGGFGRDVADHQTARRAAEAAIGHERHFFAQTFADNRRRDAQHFTHAGAAFRAFITNHDDIARFDLFARQGLHRILFAVEDARRAAMVWAFVARDFDHTAFRREVALENHQAAGRLQGIGSGAHHILPWRFFGQLGFLREGQAADRELIAGNKAAFDQTARNQPDTARFAEINRRVAPAGFEDRRLSACAC